MKWISLFLIFILFSCGSQPKQKETAQLHLQLAISLIEKENYPIALKELLIAQDLDPRNAEVQSQLGNVYYIRERFDLAEEHFKRALKIKSDFTDAKNNLARIYIETSQNKQAEILLKEVLQDYTYPFFPRAYFNYGLLEFKRKNFRQAITYLIKSLEKERDHCLAQIYLGRSYLELNENQSAVEQLSKAIQFCQPLQNDDAHYYSAIALYRNNQKDLSLTRFEELIKIYPIGKNRENSKKMIEVIKKGNL